MGILNYGSSAQHPIEFDDRALAHLQAVIGSKLRQRQSFFFSWLESVDGGGGRRCIWIDAAIPLTFSYATRQSLRMNRDWLEALMASANSTGGLRLVAEPQESSPTGDPMRRPTHYRAVAADLVRS